MLFRSCKTLTVLGMLLHGESNIAKNKAAQSCLFDSFKLLLEDVDTATTSSYTL